VERLLRAGVMRVSAVVSPSALGYRVIADVFIEVTPGKVERVAMRLVGCEHVSYVAGDPRRQAHADHARTLEAQGRLRVADSARAG